LLLPGWAWGANEIIYVSPTGSNTSPYDTWAKAATSITNALAVANDSDGGTDADTIYIAPGTYAETIVLSDIDWTNLTIIGTSAHGVTTPAAKGQVNVTGTGDHSYYDIGAFEYFPLKLWNKLGSDYEVAHSEFGPNGTVVGALNYEPCQFADGFRSLSRPDRQTPYNFIDYKLQLGHQGCIEFWYKPDNAINALDERFYSAAIDAPESADAYRFGRSNEALFMEDVAGASTLTTLPLIWDSSRFYHIAFVWDNITSFRRIYRNGVLAAQDTGLMSTTVSLFGEMIGHSHSGVSGFQTVGTQGILDSFKFSDKIRSSNQIARDYLQGVVQQIDLFVPSVIVRNEYIVDIQFPVTTIAPSGVFRVPTVVTTLPGPPLAETKFKYSGVPFTFICGISIIRTGSRAVSLPLFDIVNVYVPLSVAFSIDGPSSVELAESTPKLGPACVGSMSFATIGVIGTSGA